MKPQNLIPTLLLVAFACTATGAVDPVTTAFSETSPDYKRTVLASGRYEPETYAFAKGELLDQTGHDSSLTSLTFRQIGSLLAESLQEKDYVPTPSPEETDLLIVVHWGKTKPFSSEINGMAMDGMIDSFEGMQTANNFELPEGETSGLDRSNNPMANSADGYYAGLMDQGLAMQQMSDDMRYQANAYNARLLGYHEAVARARDLTQYITMFRDRHLDVVKEIETPRYFVILQAYDFQKMWKKKEHKLLWTTRFSIRARNNRFDENLRSMAYAASEMMGENSGELVRNLRSSRVEVGELEFLGTYEE